MTGSARRVGLAAVVLTCSIQALLVGWSATGAAVAAPSGRSADRSDPSGAQIVHSRFVSTVKLDGGVVTIRPAPLSLHPRSQLQVEDQVWATSQLMSYRPQAFGFGLVTITEHAAGVPPVVDLPAWVGLASDAQIAFSCPMTRTAPTQPDPTLPTPGDAAVVVGSSPGSPAVVYRARSEPCGSVVPSSLTNAQETLSVPWSPDGTLQFRTTECAGGGATLRRSGWHLNRRVGSGDDHNRLCPCAGKPRGHELHSQTIGRPDGHPGPGQDPWSSAAAGVFEHPDTSR